MEALLAAAGRQALYAAGILLLVAPVCALLVRRWPYRTAPLRAALWGLVLLRLVLPPDLSLPWSAGALLDVHVPAPVLWEAQTDLHALSAEEPMPLAESVAPSASSSIPWALLLPLLAWGLGSALVWGVFLRGRRRFAALTRQGDLLTEGPAAEMAARWRRRFRIRRPVRLVTADVTVSPFTLGSLRPAIFLPSTLCKRHQQEGHGREEGRHARLLEAAIAHEMAHIARWDDLRLLFERMVQALWFFHPAAWWAGARLHAERERLCDARVLACGELSPRDYGRSLLSAVRMNLEGTALTPAFGSPKERIAMRIREIVKEGHRRPRTLPALLAVTLLGLFLLPLAPTSGAAGDGAPESAEDRGPVAESGHLSDHGEGHAKGHVHAHAEGHGESHAEGHGESHGHAHGEGHLHSHGEGHSQDGVNGNFNRLSRGDWARPVAQAKLSSAFGPRVHPMTGEWVHHRGVDLVAPSGTLIEAPAAGKVTVATERYEGGARHGTVVVIDHGQGLQSFYSHLDSLAVAPGQDVARGQTLGTVGSTGEVTGPHLHFEVWRHGEPVDPAEVVAKLDDC